jgi:multidrug efflux pump subunit AcrB
MSIAVASIDKPVNTWLIILICLLGGLWALLTIGRLEDPAFTIKEAVVVTPYPGASPLEVEREVTDQLETALQRLPQVKEVRSRSTAGQSQITVEIRESFGSAELPQVWDEVRRKIGDAQAGLPPGAGPSQVNDDFGDVYGLYYALTAPDYGPADMRDFARTLRQAALQVPGVAKVVIGGLREERIFVEIPQAVLAQLGIDPTTIANALQVQNAVVDSGAVRVGDDYVRIAPSGTFTSVERIENLYLTGPGEDGATASTIRLRDIATVRRDYAEVPDRLIRHNGVPAVSLGVSATPGANIVEVGSAVEQALERTVQSLPVGVSLHPIYQQHRVVDEAVGGFIVNLVMSVGTVVLVLCLAMGWRGGVVVGGVLLLTVFGTVLAMKVWGLTMQRVSLGALIIAMGMLVDNAIVVAEGMQVRMRGGMAARAAADRVTGQTQWPLLAATVIGILAFSGIGLSDDATGEMTFSLFMVIAMSLLLSWLLAVTVTPLLASHLFQVGTADEAGQEARGGALLRGYRGVVAQALRLRVPVIIGLVVLTGAAILGFGFVSQAFFPNSATPIFYVDYWRDQGTDIRATAEDMDGIGVHLRSLEGVTDVTAFVGAGAERMMLVYTPERPNPAYGQFVVRVADRERIPALAAEVSAWLAETHPEAEARTRRITFGPGGGAKIEARFSGPDAIVLRRLADRAGAIFRESGLVEVRSDWRQREPLIAPVIAQDRATAAGVSRQDIGDALAVATVGRRVGLYREGDRLIPIVLRAPAAERDGVGGLQDRQVWSPAASAYVPMSEVVGAFRTDNENAIIRRRDKERTITAQAEPGGEMNTDAAFRAVRPKIEAMDLPDGYRLAWGGEHESATDAQASLARGLPVGFLAMLVITVALFARLRQPLIIWLCVPMAVCGVTVALLATGQPFGFMALLGFLSLSGMLIKNAIVLVDEIDTRIGDGHDRQAAVIEASVSRFTPVILASGTTILGMIPLLTDAFFSAMAVTIMGGLAFATALTLIAVPVLYATFFRIREEEGDEAKTEAEAEA